jgi:SAM-dependent methyltransferase
MKRLARALGRQFGRPTGIPGRVAGWIMANRASNRERNLRTLEILGVGPEDRVLELGFGPGFALANAAALASRGHVLGVDHSEVMLAQASRHNAAAISRGLIELRLGAVEELELPPESVDKAYAVNVLMFWRDPVAVLRRVRACLRPGGLLAITHQPRNPGASTADVERSAERILEAMRDAGYESVRSETIPLRPVSAACVVGSRPADRATQAAGSTATGALAQGPGVPGRSEEGGGLV